MDEVKAMTHTGETVGRAVGTGLRTLRRGATQVATAAEHKLAENAENVRSAAEGTRTEIGRSSRRARKQLARDAQRTAKDLARSAKRASRHARRAARDIANAPVAATQGPKRGRSTWPWLLGIGLAVAATGAVYVLRTKQANQSTQDDESAERSEHDTVNRNGSAPEPRAADQTDSPAGHRN
jgi:cobalamin biosynthesis Mg chelatase CobN